MLQPPPTPSQHPRPIPSFPRPIPRHSRPRAGISPAFTERAVLAADRLGRRTRASEAVCGRFPLGGGNDEERGRNDGMGHGRDGEGGAMGWVGVAGCWVQRRRDTRGKRGYDGSERGCDGEGQARVWRWCGWGWWRRGVGARFALVPCGRPDACAAKGVGFGPQIKSGATDFWGVDGGRVGCCSRRDTPVRARGRLRGKRRYDG